MADDRFKLPGSSYEELTKIIKAYAQCRGPAGPNDVGTRAAMDATVVSRNNGFLLATEVVEGGRNKELTELGRRLASALDYEMPDEIRGAWREVVVEQEFFQKVVSAVRIRKAMEPSSLKAHIAYSAGQPKGRSATTGAGAVIDVLVAAGLIHEEDGKYVSSSEQSRSVSVPLAVCSTVNERVLGVRHNVAHGTASSESLEPVSIQIQIQIQCTANDIEFLGQRLRTLIAEISKPPHDPTDNDA